MKTSTATAAARFPPPPPPRMMLPPPPPARMMLPALCGSTATSSAAASASATGFILLLFSFTLVTGPRRSLGLKLSDTRVYEPQIRARLGTTAHFCEVVVLKLRAVPPPARMMRPATCSSTATSSVAPSASATGFIPSVLINCLWY